MIFPDFKQQNMVCSICTYAGHNCRRCPYKPTAAGKPAAVAGLRAPLPDHHVIWTYRDDKDAYSNFDRVTICNEYPERDHVFEIQLMDAAYTQYSFVSSAAITRQETLRIQGLANCLENTNVTTRKINRSKKGPFTSAKNTLISNDFQSMGCPGVDHYFYTKSGKRRAGKYTGMTVHNWERVKKEVVVSFEAIERQIESAVHHQRNAELFSDSLRDVFNSLRIEE
jgi:hypothetical protein